MRSCFRRDLLPHAIAVFIVLSMLAPGPVAAEESSGRAVEGVDFTSRDAALMAAPSSSPPSQSEALIDVSPTTLTFYVPEDEASTLEYFTITNTGTAQLDYLIWNETCPCMTIGPFDDSYLLPGASQQHWIQVGTCGLPVGVNYCTASVTSNAANQSEVTMYMEIFVAGPDPEFDEYPSSLVFQLPTEGTRSRTLRIRNLGVADLDFTFLSDLCSCNTMVPGSGTLSLGEMVEVDVTVDPCGREPGTYECSLRLSTNDPNESLKLIPLFATIHADEPPILDPEPTYTRGTTNTISYTPNGTNVLTQCSQDPDFTEVLQEIDWTTDEQVTFSGLPEGLIYYRAKNRFWDVESSWSELVSSTQDATPPETSAGPLHNYQYTMSFDIPFSASDAGSGVDDVYFFVRDEEPVSPLTFGWEDGTSTHLGVRGDGSPNVVASNDGSRFHSGNRSLLLEIQDSGPAPHLQVFLVWIGHLLPGDEVTASFWRYDNRQNQPNIHIWGLWNDSLLGVGYIAGDAGGNPDDGPGNGWDRTEHTWVVPENHRGLVIVAWPEGDEGRQLWIDDLEFTVPSHASLQLPDESKVANYSLHGIYADSPIPFTAPTEGTYWFYTAATDHVGNEEIAPLVPQYFDIMTTVLILSDTPEHPGSPRELWLHQNTPNPFNPATTIRYDLPQEGPVTLTIFDVSGRRVGGLLNREWREPGTYRMVWDGTDDRGAPVGSGIYLYRLLANDREITRRMVLLR